jgi:hypothetical protein
VWGQPRPARQYRKRGGGVGAAKAGEAISQKRMMCGVRALPAKGEVPHTFPSRKRGRQRHLYSQCDITIR